MPLVNTTEQRPPNINSRVNNATGAEAVKDPKDRTIEHHPLKKLSDRYDLGDVISTDQNNVIGVRIKQGRPDVGSCVLKEFKGAGCNSPDFLAEIKSLTKCYKSPEYAHVVRLVESFEAKASSCHGIVMTPQAEMNLKQFLDPADNIVASGEPFGYNWTQRPDHLKLFHGCLLDAMEYLTKLNIRHRDIKCKNVLVEFFRSTSMPETLTPRILICDFGLSRSFDDGENDTTSSFKHGTPRYKAPELIGLGGSDANHSEKTDVWALGCVFFEIHVALKGWSLEHFLREHRGSASELIYANHVDDLEKWMGEIPPRQTEQRDIDEHTRRYLMLRMVSQP